MSTPPSPPTVTPLELPDRMTASDAIFWLAESANPGLRPIIAGLYLLDRAPDPDRLAAGARAAIAFVPRLRQRVVPPGRPFGLPGWADDPHFDLPYHLRHVSLPAPGTLAHLLELAAKLIATPLDRERPLWESYWFDGLDGGRAAYLFKMHHSLVDGVGSIALATALTQGARDEPPLRVRAQRRRRRRPGLLERAGDLAAGPARLAGSVVRDGLRAGERWVRDPRGEIGAWGRTATGLAGMLQDLARPAIEDELAVSAAGISRRLDVLDVSLERLRKIKAPLGVSINDVVLTAYAGAVGAYRRERAASVPELRCMVPMSLRGRDERDQLGNRVGMFNVTLPVDEREPRRRLEAIVAQTRAAKRDQRGAAYPAALGVLPLLPTPVLEWLSQNALGKVNLVCTNVPGLPARRYMAGAEVQAIYPFASPVEKTPMILALLSYAGQMHFGLDTDPEAIPDPHRLMEFLRGELDALEGLSGTETP